MVLISALFNVALLRVNDFRQPLHSVPYLKQLPQIFRPTLWVKNHAFSSLVGSGSSRQYLSVIVWNWRKVAADVDSSLSYNL